MAQLFSNNATSTLASGITDVATTITLATGEGTLFQSPASPDYELATITDGTNWEVVKITSRSTDTLTVARGFEGTARSWSAATVIEGRITKSTLETFAQSGDTVAIGTSAVASGTHAVAIGASNTSSGQSSSALGYLNTVSGWQAVAAGYNCSVTTSNSIAIGNAAQANTGSGGVAIGTSALSGGSDVVSIGTSASGTASSTIAIGQATVSGLHSVAIGRLASCSGDYGAAFGKGAINRIGESNNITGLSLIRKDNGEAATDEHLYFTGSQAIVFSKEIDLKTLADDVSTITIPTGSTFYPDEVGVVVTSADTVTVQPEVSFGITGNATAVLTQTATTKSTAKGRDIFTPAKDGVNSLTASVKVGATATTLLGRFYWKGILVEDE